MCTSPGALDLRQARIWSPRPFFIAGTFRPLSGAGRRSRVVLQHGEQVLRLDVLVILAERHALRLRQGLLGLVVNCRIS